MCVTCYIIFNLWVFLQDICTRWTSFRRRNWKHLFEKALQPLQWSHTVFWDTVSEIPILKCTLWNCCYLLVTLLNIIPNVFVCNKCVFIFLCHWVPNCAEYSDPWSRSCACTKRVCSPSWSQELASVLEVGLVSEMKILVMSYGSWIKKWFLTDCLIT